MHFVYGVSDDLMGEADRVAKNKDYMALKSVSSKLSLDMIATCAFGVEANAFTDENSPFVKNVMRIFMRENIDAVKMLASLIPGGRHVFRLLDMSIFKPEATEFLMQTISNSMKQRRETKTRRNDLIDLMLDALNG
jgi:cytochrome P450 family 9